MPAGSHRFQAGDPLMNGGMIGRDNIDAGHEKACFLSQALHNTVKLRSLSAMYGEHDLVTEPIAPKIKHNRESKCKNKPGLSAKNASCENQQNC